MAQDPKAPGSSSPTNRPEGEETPQSTIPNYAEIPTKIWTVFEQWQNEKLHQWWGSLATFSSHTEAVKYAQAYIRNLERLTERLGEPCTWSQRSEDPNGDRTWFIPRAPPPLSISTVRVIGSEVHDRAEEAETHHPMGFKKDEWEELQRAGASGKNSRQPQDLGFGSE